MAPLPPLPAPPRVLQNHKPRKTNLCRWGASQGVRIPKPVCEELGIETGSQLTLQVGKDEMGLYVTIRKAPEMEHRTFSDAPYISMDELFKDYDGSSQPGECDWGADEGAEVVA